MKKQLITAAVTSLLSVLSAAAQGEQPAPQGQPSQEELQRMIAEAMKNQKPPAPPAPTMSKEEAVAYFSENAGANFGFQIKNDKVLDRALFLKGLNAALEGKIEPEAIDPVKMEEAQRAFQVAQEDALKAEGVDYLAENKKKEGIKVTESGLQYKVNAKGEGEKPAVGDTVKVHYTGKLTDGTVFDTSSNRGEPLEFVLGVGQVIPGWDEGIQLMSPGAKYELFIPQELAYGQQGSRGGIPPYAALHFEVELVSIAKAAKKEMADKEEMTDDKKMADKGEKEMSEEKEMADKEEAPAKEE